MSFAHTFTHTYADMICGYSCKHAVLGKIHINALFNITFEARHIYILCNQIKEYIFLHGGGDKKWIKQFSKKVKAVAKDPVLSQKPIWISIESSFVDPKSRK